MNGSGFCVVNGAFSYTKRPPSCNLALPIKAALLGGLDVSPPTCGTEY
jgi:hypothetical protein